MVHMTEAIALEVDKEWEAHAVEMEKTVVLEKPIATTAEPLCFVSDPPPTPEVDVREWSTGPGVYIDEHGK